MKTSVNVVVFTILSCGLARSYRAPSKDNIVKGLQSYRRYPETYPDSDTDTEDDTDYGGHSKEILFSDDDDQYEPEYGFPEYHEKRFPGKYDYPKVKYWPNYKRQWKHFKDWSDGGWVFPGDTGSRFPTPSPPTTTPSIADQTRLQMIQDQMMKDCKASCPSTSEYNPVCGTDAVTYTNPGKLECAKIYCGVDVEIYRHSTCIRNMQPIIRQTITTTTQAPFVTKPTKPTFEAPPEPSDGPISTTTGCPDGSDDCYEIDIRSRNL